jgi:hypothetical protein
LATSWALANLASLRRNSSFLGFFLGFSKKNQKNDVHVDQKKNLKTKCVYVTVNVRKKNLKKKWGFDRLLTDPGVGGFDRLLTDPVFPRNFYWYHDYVGDTNAGPTQKCSLQNVFSSAQRKQKGFSQRTAFVF